MVVTFENSFWSTNIHGAEIETGILTSFITFFQGFENRDISENVEVRDKSMLVSIFGDME